MFKKNADLAPLSGLDGLELGWMDVQMHEQKQHCIIEINLWLSSDNFVWLSSDNVNIFIRLCQHTGNWTGLLVDNSDTRDISCYVITLGVCTPKNTKNYQKQPEFALKIANKTKRYISYTVITQCMSSQKYQKLQQKTFFKELPKHYQKQQETFHITSSPGVCTLQNALSLVYFSFSEDNIVWRWQESSIYKYQTW